MFFCLEVTLSWPFLNIIICSGVEYALKESDIFKKWVVSIQHIENSLAFFSFITAEVFVLQSTYHFLKCINKQDSKRILVATQYTWNNHWVSFNHFFSVPWKWDISHFLWRALRSKTQSAMELLWITNVLQRLKKGGTKDSGRMNLLLELSWLFSQWWKFAPQDLVAVSQCPVRAAPAAGAPAGRREEDTTVCPFKCSLILLPQTDFTPSLNGACKQILHDQREKPNCLLFWQDCLQVQLKNFQNWF